MTSKNKKQVTLDEVIFQDFGPRLTKKEVVVKTAQGVYFKEPAQWVPDATGIILDPWQKETMNKLFAGGKNKMSVAASHGAGKTFLSGIIVNFFLSVFTPARVAITGPCVEENEKILLADGRCLPIKELNGKYVGVHSILEDFTFAPRLANVFPNGIKPVYRIKTRSGREAVRTSNHPFLKLRGWTMVSDLKIGDFIAIPTHLPVHGKQQIPEEDVKIIAYLIAEGCTTKAGHGHIYFTQNPGRILEEFRECVEKKNCYLSANADRNYAIVGNVKTEGGRGINPVKDLCKIYDLYGKHSWEKRIPVQIFELTDDLVKTFISRLFAGDGHVRNSGSTKEILYFSTSHELIQDLNKLILRFGIIGRMRTRHRPLDGKKVGFGSRRDMYEWWASGKEAEKFAKQIGVFGAEQAIERMITLCEASKLRTSLINTMPPETVTELKAFIEQSPTTVLSNFRNFNVFRPSNGIGKQKVREIADIAGAKRLLNLSQSEIGWDEIVSIEYVGERMTYGMEVPGPENYVTDFIEHNTGKQTRNQIWSNVNIIWDRSVFKDDFAWQKTKFYLKGKAEETYAVWMTSKEPKTIEGFHGPDGGKNLLWMVEEGKAVADPVYESIQGALSHENNFMYIGSTCGGAAGFFFKTFHTLKHSWDNIKVPWYESSRISPQQVETWKETWGEDSPIFRARVMAEFPEEDEQVIVPLPWLERAVIQDDYDETA